MDYSNIDTKALTKKIYSSRVRILGNHPFFAVILIGIQFSFTLDEKSISTDGKTIYINPDFLSRLTDREVDIAILHELMHIILKHPYRYHNSMNNDFFHLACDIVVNSNIMDAIGSQDDLTINGRILPHLAPDGKEGILYTSEDIYKMLISTQLSSSQTKKKNKKNKKCDAVQSDTCVAGDFAVNTQRVMTVTSDIDDKLLLRMASFSDYKLVDGWDSRIIVYSHTKINPNLLSLDKVRVLMLDNANHASIKVLNNSIVDLVPIPYYSTNSSTYLDDDVLNKSASKTTYNFDFINCDIGQKEIDLLPLIPYSSKELEKEERKYRKFVYKYYLSMPSIMKTYFNNVVKTAGFTKDDPNIIYKVRNYIATCAKYSVHYPEPNQGDDPILFFMSKSHVGKCTHFASAATLLYRAIGIPARFTVGYSIEADSEEVVDVYKEQAHAWVEVYLDNVGWIPVDPTPVIAQGSPSIGDNGSSDEQNQDGQLDSHNRWADNSNESENSIRMEEINQQIMAANELENNTRSKSCGKTPGSVELMIKDLTEPKIDWRVLLNQFIQEDIVDYSFCPPDKRFSDSDFLLPDFNEPDEKVKDVLFMVDCSGSMSDTDIKDCFSEIQGAINQFNGKLQGQLGFFDSTVHFVVPFDGDTDITKIKPKGRGGTDFFVVFDYIKKNMSDNLPTSLIILSDGYAPYPAESVSMGIPTMWVFNNEQVKDPSFGKCIRFKHSD